MTMPPTNRQAQKAKKPPAGRDHNMTLSLCSVLHDLLIIIVLSILVPLCL